MNEGVEMVKNKELGRSLIEILKIKQDMVCMYEQVGDAEVANEIINTMTEIENDIIDLIKD